MENQQRLVNMRGRPIVLALTLIATVPLILSGLFYLAAGHQATVTTRPSTYVTIPHKPAPDTMESTVHPGAGLIVHHE